MSTRDRTLLGEIESDLLNDKPLEDVLLKVLALGGRASSGPMRDWASHELNGYAESDSDLPSYRRVPASIKIDAVLGYNMIQGQTIGILSLPEAVRNDIKEEVELPFGVAELEDLVRDTNKDGLVRVTFQLSADVAKLMSRSLPPEQHVTDVYWAISRTSVSGVLSRIRTKLVELVAELTASMPANQETPSAEQATQAIQFIQTGKRSTITFANAQSSNGSTSTVTQGAEPHTDSEPSWWTLGRKVAAFIVGCAIIAGAVFAYLALQH